MIITIKDELVGTIERLALERGVTAQEYAENYVNSHLLSQYKQSIVDKITNESIGNLPQIETVILTKKQELKDAFDLANPIRFTVTE
jgi:hypothetical protein